MGKASKGGLDPKISQIVQASIHISAGKETESSPGSPAKRDSGGVSKTDV